MRAYAIAHGEAGVHASKLKAGLARLPPEFVGAICWACDGFGEYEQTYTAGCGGGYYRCKGVCGHCDGTGLLSGSKPAPDSVREQVLNAAQR